VNSIRGRLLAILIGTTLFVWIAAITWIYTSTQAEVERVLDARLTEAARMVNSLLADHRIPIRDDATSSKPAIRAATKVYERQLSCQIWSLDGTLVARSESAPGLPLTKAMEGFSEDIVDGETWRVFTIENPELGVRVMVGDTLRMRDRLVGDVVKGMVHSAAVAIPFLVGLIWLSVSRGLIPLSDLACALSRRSANELSPLPSAGIPKEIAPAVQAINELFGRVEAARERERSFTAFAAHELKTPLAGLKTQAQVALSSTDAAVHANALQQIVAGVDRTSRLVNQLLDMAALEASDVQPCSSDESLNHLVNSVVADLLSLASTRGIAIEVDSSKHDVRAKVEPQFFILALRNLLENALDHAKSVVRCQALDQGQWVRVVVEDDGPGILEPELERVTAKFVRGRNKSMTGSGLGLAIAKIAMARIDGKLTLHNREPTGLVAMLEIPRQAA
jgi:two-component system sensor histidine kinase QseC